MDNNNPNDIIPLRKAVFIILAIIVPVLILVVVGMLALFTDIFTRMPQEVAEDLIEEPYEEPPHLVEEVLPGFLNIGFGVVVTVAGTGVHGSRDGYPAEFNMPSAVAVGTQNMVIVADTFNNVLRQINLDTSVETLAGVVRTAGTEHFPLGFYIDGAAQEAGFYRPTSIAVHGNRIYIADSENHAIRILVEGRVYTISGARGPGHLDGEPYVSMFYSPMSIAMGPNGYLYVADTGNHVIRRISPVGYVTTIAGMSGRSGHADGMASQALFYSPKGVIAAPDGRIFVSDTGNHLIREIRGGIVSTLAGGMVFLEEHEHDRFGDGWDDAPLGGFEDGIGAFASFNQPMGIDLWENHLIIADSASHSIRLVSLTGEVTTLTGSGYPNYRSGTIEEAEFHFPTGVYVFGDFLFIADSGNNKIRLVRLSGEEVQVHE